MQRTIHHVIAFGVMFAPNVLHHADIAAIDDHVHSVVVAVQNGTKMRTGSVTREVSRVVWRTRKQDRRAFCALWDQNYRVQLDSVSHRNHHLASRVVPTIGRWYELGRGLAGQLWILLR